jgi:hypothetical protein
MSNLELKKRLRLICLIILAVGLCSAALIYRLAEDIPDDSLGYRIVNGVAYPLSTRDSKKYQYELQRFGGKAAVMFDDLNRWFTELWQGKALARTLAWISVLLSLAIYLFARSLPNQLPDQEPDSSEAGERDSPH